MRTHGIARLARGAGYVAAVVLALVLAGDRGRAAVVPAVIYGQDPLEILELKVRPNVIVVLDSSGSMKWGTTAPSGPASNFYPPQAGDHPRSKTFQAKQVLKQIVTNNQDKVSFMFGQYTQDPVIVMGNRNAATSSGTNLATSRANRFTYVADSATSPSMVTTQLSIQNDQGGSGGRGIQSWQLIYPARTGPPAQSGWNTFYYEERIGGTTYICTAQLPSGPGPSGEAFYRQGGKAATGDADIAGSLAAALKAAINNPTGCARPAARNTYDVTYTATSGVFTFTRTGANSNSWRPLWQANAGRPNSIRGAFNAPTANPNLGGGPFTTQNSPFTLLYRPVAAADNTRTYNTGGAWTTTNFTFSEGSGASMLTSYNAVAARFWNGEVIDVVASGASAGEVCNVTFPTAAQRTNPPTITVRGVASCGGAVTATVPFTWGGAFYDGNNNSGCNGFQKRVDLIPCDLKMPPALTQVDTLHPWLDNEFPLDATGMPHSAPRALNLPAPATTTPYTERQDGTWSVNTYPPYWAGGIKAMGSTPVAYSIRDVKTAFTNIWNNGQAAGAPAPPYALDAIRNHKNPKEKTILLFVTDGADTCAGSGDAAALTAADFAKNLYQPVEGDCKDPNDTGDSLTSTPICEDVDRDGIEGFAEPASSVQTFMIGYGDAVNTPDDVNRLNWMAWGGSGLYKNFSGSSAGSNAATDANLRVDRAKCKTCQDAYIATNASTLAAVLQGIINQGAQDGDFSAAQSITESVYEYVDKAGAPGEFDASNPRTRYKALAPTRVISSFTLPGFRGQVKAYKNDGSGGTEILWSAGDKLNALVRAGFDPACPAQYGGALGECRFSRLHGDFDVAAAAIKRRIYTTSRNGTFLNLSSAATDLMARTANGRVNLWPPDPALVPTGTGEGILPGSGLSLDQILGLPLDTTATAAADFTNLQNQYKACMGTNLPSGCSGGTALSRMQTARREAREMILAFMAGAEPVPVTGGIKRTDATGVAATRNQILYRYRSSVLSDSELATAAVVTPPLPATPDATPYVPEYKQFRDGPYVLDGTTAPDSDTMIRQGFGLRNPDADGSTSTRNNLKPVMTVVYAPGNDMLHAFRAGPNASGPNQSPTSACDTYVSTLSSTYDCGGEELWGFVPFDQLNALTLIYRNQPQTRANHVYMLARGVRFSDVFVPQPLTNVNVGGNTIASLQGVWRRIMFFGRGIGGKYVTALDVTAPGPYTATRLNTEGPIPIWSRGNPDTPDGRVANLTNNNTLSDRNAYARMGQTWSIPVVGYVDRTNPIYVSPRVGRGGIDHALFMGSGYGDTASEGTTFYTLDALTGDVVASADVETVASSYGLTRSLSYPNALVANPAGFNPKAFSLLTTVHPAAAQVTRVYVGDVHGRVWKFLTSRPDVAIPLADLGPDQPVGTAASLLGLPPQPDASVPYVFVTSGADSRSDGPFRIFGFVDKGVDGLTTTSGTTLLGATRTYLPVEPLFERIYDQGDPEANCGYTTEAVFRGTVQPATAFECDSVVFNPSTGERTCVGTTGRVFFAGTRLSLPNTKYAPPTPLACGQGQYPCRSQFDSIIYALGAKTGLAAYDLNAAGDDAYRVFRDSRLAAIQMLADPDPERGGSSFTPDESQIKGTPEPPPPYGVPPTANTATANVLLTREPGQPPPSVRYGSTVCQQ